MDSQVRDAASVPVVTASVPVRKDAGKAPENEALVLQEAGPVELHPPPGFEDCKHPVAKPDCSDGWCQIPKGCFVMGSPETEWGRGRNSEERVAVTLTHNLEVSRTEITRAAWGKLVAKPTQPDPKEACTEQDCPVSQVSWYEALHFANLLSEQVGYRPCYVLQQCTGDLGNDFSCKSAVIETNSVYTCEGYRLPTRTEFEYLSRAGTTTPFYSGGITVYEDQGCRREPNLETIAWYCHNSKGTSHPVGLKVANAFGLHDIIGNVFEWASDNRNGASSPGGTDPEGAIGDDNLRFILGCSMNMWASACRAASRGSGPRDGRAPNVGFRLVRSLAID